ncbi:MAG: SDR family oxidoreductase [Pseudomonadales bacterium]
MNLFVTGTDGYIGTVLAPFLLKAGHQVTGLDTGYYKDGWLYSRPKSGFESPRTIVKDLRLIVPADLEGIDAIVHMAELSNDPLGENNPEITTEINHMGSVNLAETARKAGIERFVYTSSCSIYGVSDADFVDETSETNPQTAYARCKALVERDVGMLMNENFSPVFLRNATAYGASPRMRFDIVLNNLMGLAWTTKDITMTSDGSPWRPLVHIEDICRAILCALEAPSSAVAGEIFNVGVTEENYRIREVADIVAETVSECKVTMGPSGGDNRSYRVNFDKIKNNLPGFQCQWTLRDGAAELKSIFEQIQMDYDIFDFRAFTRLKQLKYLTSTGQIDERFYWKF